jgi:hypothetical protein
MTVANTPESVIGPKPKNPRQQCQAIEPGHVSARLNWLELRMRCNADTADRILHFLQEMHIGLAPAEE